MESRQGNFLERSLSKKIETEQKHLILLSLAQGGFEGSARGSPPPSPLPPHPFFFLKDVLPKRKHLVTKYSH